MLILDTDIISELMRDTPSQRVVAWLDRQDRQGVWMTAVTVMKLHHGVQSLPPGRRKSALQHALDRLTVETIGERIAAFDNAAARVTANIAADRRRAGRQGELRDTMIAGIAIATGASLAIRNMRHFDDLLSC